MLRLKLYLDCTQDFKVLPRLEQLDSQRKVLLYPVFHKISLLYRTFFNLGCDSDLSIRNCTDWYTLTLIKCLKECLKDRSYYTKLPTTNHNEQLF